MKEGGETVTIDQVFEDEIGLTEKDVESLIEKKEDKEKKEQSVNSGGTEKMPVEVSGNGIEGQNEESDNGTIEMENNNEQEVGEEKSKEPVTPVAFSNKRPVRERKSIKRLAVAVEPESIRVDKGPGTALKDIPNVANQLEKRKAGETFKLLHSVLFGTHSKAFKRNLSEFSGFTLRENEEMHKIKDKLDRFVIEKLLEFCDVLDIHVVKTTRTRKEGIMAGLLNFLAAPHVTTDVVQADNELLSSAVKRKRGSDSIIPVASSGSTDEKHSTRECSEGKENENGVSDASEDELAEHSESKDGNNDPKGVEEPKQGLFKSSAKKVASRLKRSPTTRKVTTISSPKKYSTRSTSNLSKVVSSRARTTVPSSSKETGVETAKRMRSALSKYAIYVPTSKEKTGKKLVKGKDEWSKGLNPSEDELRCRIAQTLHEVDFNKAADILKKLAAHYGMKVDGMKVGDDDE